MVERIRARDWRSTLLGPVEVWSKALRSTVAMLVAHEFPMVALWGPELVQVYNDGYRLLMGTKHPAGLGQATRDCWPEVWHINAPIYDRVWAGETVTFQDALYPITRHGPLEDAWFTLTYSPLRDDGGAIAGILVTVFETTERHLADKRREESEAVREVALAGGRMGSWRWDLARRQVSGDVHFLSLWGLPPSQDPLPLSAFIDRQSPTGVTQTEAIVTKPIAADEEFDAEIEVVSGPTSGRWLRWRGRVATNDSSVLYGVSFDITEQKRAEEALRKSEARQAFLLELSDTLRPLTDPTEIIAQATRVLGEYMRADRTFIAIMEPDGINLDVHHEHLCPGSTSVIGRHNLDQFGTFVSRRLVEGHVMAVEDVASLSLTPAERAHYAAVGIAAYLLVPLVRYGRFAACFTCNHQTPRPWKEADISIVRQTADRTWASLERARVEAALRESEERFRQFAEASTAGLWIRDADTLTMEFVSPAIEAIYGVGPEALLGDVTRWAAMIVPEDRDAALVHLNKARHGDVAVHEFRIQRRSDGAFRWIRNTDFPLRSDGQVSRIGGIAEDVTETKLATEHSAVLLAELQHRVRNIMGMIRSMTNRTAAGPADVAAYRSLLEGRLLALARVQALLTREANAGGSLRSILEGEIAAQAHHGGQYELTGPDVRLSPKAIEVLTLAFHELATNALKYGALSVPDGHLTVTWQTTEKRGRPWLALDWAEAGAPAREPSTRRGFGSELIEARIPYELGGRGKITVGPDGARCHLEFPLNEGESILETDAPQPAIVFGGTLDMTGAPDLTGRTVLVVEDDYYMATDTVSALRGAGADVLGPCPSLEAAQDLLEAEMPTHAVLDLNLGGGGPRFELAHLLKTRNVPFIFLTGYDPDVIPPDLAEVVRLQKPLPFRDIVEAVGRL